MRFAATLILLGLIAVPLAAQDKKDADDPERMKALSTKVLGTKLPPTKTKKLTPKELAQQKEQEITRNWNRALKNYEGIIDSREEATVATMEKRIGANLKLVRTQNKRLTSSQQQLRQLKLTYTGRFMILQGMFEQQRLDKPTYVSRLKTLADEFEFQMRGLVTDVKFYRKESTTTKLRLKNLQQVHKLNMMTLARRRPAKTKRPLTALEKLLASIRGAGRFRVQNVFDAADCRHTR